MSTGIIISAVATSSQDVSADAVPAILREDGIEGAGWEQEWWSYNEPPGGSSCAGAGNTTCCYYVASQNF